MTVVRAVAAGGRRSRGPAATAPPRRARSSTSGQNAPSPSMPMPIRPPTATSPSATRPYPSSCRRSVPALAPAVVAGADGSTTQPRRYAITPKPPKNAATTKPSRTTTGSTPRYSATPPATPPSSRWSALRVRRRRGAGGDAGGDAEASGRGSVGSGGGDSRVGASMSSIIRSGAPGRHRGSPGADPEPPPPEPGTCRSQIRGSARDHRGSPTPPRVHPRPRLEEPDVVPDHRCTPVHPTGPRAPVTRSLLAGVAERPRRPLPHRAEPRAPRVRRARRSRAAPASCSTPPAGCSSPTDDPSAAAAATRGDRSRNDLVQVAGARRGHARRAARRPVDRARFQRRPPLAARARGHGHRVDRRPQRAADRRADRRARPAGARARVAAPTATCRTTASVVRVVVGGALVVAGVGAFLATQGAFRAVGQGLLAVAVILGGLGLDLRTVAVAAVERAGRGAQRAHPLRRTRRDGRAPARLGAPDPRDHPTPRRRPARRRGPRPAPGARAARVAVRPRAGRTPTSTSATRSKPRPPTSSSAQGVPIETVRVGGACPLDDQLRALVPRRARRWSTRRATRARPWSPSTKRSSPNR